MSATSDECDRTTDQASTPRIERTQRVPFRAVNPSDLLCVARDGLRFIVAVTLRFGAMQTPHLIGLPTVFFQLLRFLISLPLDDSRFGTPS